MTELSKPMIVAVDYRLTLKAFIQATHAAWRTQTIFQALAAMLVLLVLSSLFVVGLGARLEDQAPVLWYTLMALAFYYLYPTIAFASRPRHRVAQSFEFTKDSFRYRKGDTEETLPWSAIKSAAETRGFYVLSLPERQNVAVPKSAFGPGQEQRFRLLAALQGVPIH
ncbi:MAG TPA: YcxB family protein [Actinomycetota bacterium]|nr:YcxB family protein [Actinomycetota bacterium]